MGTLWNEIGTWMYNWSTAGVEGVYNTGVAIYQGVANTVQAIFPFIGG